MCLLYAIIYLEYTLLMNMFFDQSIFISIELLCTVYSTAFLTNMGVNHHIHSSFSYSMQKRQTFHDRIEFILASVM